MKQKELDRYKEAIAKYEADFEMKGQLLDDRKEVVEMLKDRVAALQSG